MSRRGALLLTWLAVLAGLSACGTVGQVINEVGSMGRAYVEPGAERPGQALLRLSLGAPGVFRLHPAQGRCLNTEAVGGGVAYTRTESALLLPSIEHTLDGRDLGLKGLALEPRFESRDVRVSAPQRLGLVYSTGLSGAALSDCSARLSLEVKEGGRYQAVVGRQGGCALELFEIDAAGMPLPLAAASPELCTPSGP